MDCAYYLCDSLFLLQKVYKKINLNFFIYFNTCYIFDIALFF